MVSTLLKLIFLLIIIIFVCWILNISRARNSWDVLACNTTLGVISLFMIGIIVDSIDAWLRIISFLGVIVIGIVFASISTKKS